MGRLPPLIPVTATLWDMEYSVHGEFPAVRWIGKLWLQAIDSHTSVQFSPLLMKLLLIDYPYFYFSLECPRQHKDDVGAIFPGLDLEGKMLLICNTRPIYVFSATNSNVMHVPITTEAASSPCRFWGNHFLQECSLLPLVSALVWTWFNGERKLTWKRIACWSR